MEATSAGRAAAWVVGMALAVLLALAFWAAVAAGNPAALLLVVGGVGLLLGAGHAVLGLGAARPDEDRE